MDKAALRKEVEKIIVAFKKEERPLGFVCLSPEFKELNDTSYVLTVFSSWLEKMDNCYEALGIVTEMMYKLLSKETLRYINRVEICDQNGEVHCETSDVIINEAGIEVS